MGWTIVALRRIRVDVVPTLGVLLLVLATALIAALAPRILAALADDAVRGADRRRPGRRAEHRPDRAHHHRRRAARTTRWPRSGPPATPCARRSRRAWSASSRRRTPWSRAAGSGSRSRPRTRRSSGSGSRRGSTTTSATWRVEPRPRRSRPATTSAPRPSTACPSSRPACRARRPTGSASRSARSCTLLGDPGDPLLGRTPQDVYAFARITGIYEVPDETSEFWLDDPLAIHPVIRALSSEVQLLDAALVVDPAAHAPLTAFYGQLGRPLRYTWRYFLDDGAITARCRAGTHHRLPPPRGASTRPRT